MGLREENMITFEFHQEEHQIGDRFFPEKHYSVFIDTDELDFETLCLELFELTKVAGFRITQKAWDDAKEYIESEVGFFKPCVDKK